MAMFPMQSSRKVIRNWRGGQEGPQWCVTSLFEFPLLGANLFVSLQLSPLLISTKWPIWPVPQPLVLIDWFCSFLMVAFFSFFPHLLIFDWLTDIVNFTLLGTGNVCIYTFLSFVLGFSSLEIVWSFWVLLLRFVSQNQSGV